MPSFSELKHTMLLDNERLVVMVVIQYCFCVFYTQKYRYNNVPLLLGGFSTLFGHFMKSLISHFYTAACKFKVKRSDSQNFDEKKLPGRCVSPLFGSILSRY